MGFGIGRHEHLEAAAEARHKRGHLTGRLYDLIVVMKSVVTSHLVAVFDRSSG